MKIPSPSSPLDLSAKLAEFDVWITPSLGEIRDTDRFQAELARIVQVIEALAAATRKFRSIEDCSASAITEALLGLIQKKPQNEASTILQGAASMLFLCTGKSDNNLKCQLPLHLRDSAKWSGFPSVRSKQKSVNVTSVAIPRILNSEDYMGTVAKLCDFPEEQKRLLMEFVRFVLSDDKYVAQLWSIGHSYAKLKAFKREKDLLTPLVIFQVRGSVSATGGHAPERQLRERFDEWGLVRGVDYNLADVVVAEEQSKGGRIKTRAYDFVLPFKTPGWSQRLYIQSQFYAGDSGSVSHKNVDQTSTSRHKVLEQNRDALFIEFLDGAGYFSSLNGDLKTLLSISTTYSFVQVRSAPIRLRRALQEIGFCTPLEVEHAIAKTGGDRKKVANMLKTEGYAGEEVERCINEAIKAKIIVVSGTTLVIHSPRRPIARRYLLLDTIAVAGRALSEVMPNVAGHILIPGFGALFGVKLTELLDEAIKIAPGFATDLQDSKTLLGDIQWLEEHRFVISA